MAEPTITFAFKHGDTDIPWTYQGLVEEETDKDGFMAVFPSTDLLVWTGGGILGSLPIPTTVSGARDCTIRPSVSPYVIPQLFIERSIMYNASLVGKNTNRYTMAVRVTGTATSDIYIEAFDDTSMSTTSLEILSGTSNNGNNSFINAIRTTTVEPPWPWNGNSPGAAYLRGTEHRVALNNSATITDSTMYYNIFVELPTDCSTFHCQPVLAFRYLYT